MRGLVERQAIEQPGQFPGPDRPHLGHALGPAEPVTLQPFMPQTETVAVPVENLDRIPPTVAEAEQHERIDRRVCYAGHWDHENQPQKILGTEAHQ